MSDQDIEQLIARVSVLEMFSMAALGLYLSNSRNDPDFQKAAFLIDNLEAGAKSLLLHSSTKAIAESYARDLAEQLRQNIRSMRGEGGQPH